MTAKTRPNIQCWNSELVSTKFSKYSNLLVSGCSYVYNNSDDKVATWPYYLRFLINFDEVYDCSQSGAGANHVFNSIINELETNKNLTSSNTLVIVMWPNLSRTDVIAETTVTKPWHFMSNYNFNTDFSTLSIFRTLPNSSTELEKLCKQYSMLISPEAQIYESCLKIIALQQYLISKSFDYIFLSWEPVQTTAFNLPFDNCLSLGEFADTVDMRIPGDGHPTTEAHLQWCNKHLIPLLESKNLIK
jgi:5-methylcytosine-specific restriction endonuclease McrA